VDLFAVLPSASFRGPSGQDCPTGREAAPGPSAPERVISAELQARGQSSDALAMMVTSMVRMVQMGKERDSRWKSS
jgi:hypothetical protein